jgi:hypothetical protein
MEDNFVEIEFRYLLEFLITRRPDDPVRLYSDGTVTDLNGFPFAQMKGWSEPDMERLGEIADRLGLGMRVDDCTEEEEFDLGEFLEKSRDPFSDLPVSEPDRSIRPSPEEEGEGEPEEEEGEEESV